MVKTNVNSTPAAQVRVKLRSSGVRKTVITAGQKGLPQVRTATDQTGVAIIQISAVGPDDGATSTVSPPAKFESINDLKEDAPSDKFLRVGKKTLGGILGMITVESERTVVANGILEYIEPQHLDVELDVGEGGEWGRKRCTWSNALLKGSDAS